MNLEQKAEDKEFKRESALRYKGSIIGTPISFEKKDFIQTPKLHDDLSISSNNNTPIISSRPILEKSANFEHSNVKDDALKSNRNGINKENSKNMINNENLFNFGYNINQHSEYMLTNTDMGNSKMNGFNVNINPNVNLFNFPIMKATGQLNQLGSNYYSENINNYTNMYKYQPQIPCNNNDVKNSLFSMNNNNQPQKLLTNNNININNTININIDNNILGNVSTINNPQILGINNANFVNNYKGNKFINQNLNYAEMDKEELAKYVEILGKDQAGCRLLQKRICEDPSFSNDYLYQQMVNKITDFMYDAFGNYLIQKILETISEDKKKEIIRLIAPEFLDLGCSPHGTRVIQKIIEVITHNHELVIYFIELLEKHSLNLMKDINGNHIIIKYVFNLSSPFNDFIYKQLVLNIVEICTHKHGCCVLQKCIEGANDKQKVSNNI